MSEKCEKLKKLLNQNEATEKRLLQSQEKLLRTELTLIKSKDMLITGFLDGIISKSTFLNKNQKIEETLTKQFEIFTNITTTLEKISNHKKKIKEKIKEVCSI